jgi:hypothetical protein
MRDGPWESARLTKDLDRDQEAATLSRRPSGARRPIRWQRPARRSARRRVRLGPDSPEGKALKFDRTTPEEWGRFMVVDQADCTYAIETSDGWFIGWKDGAGVSTRISDPKAAASIGYQAFYELSSVSRYSSAGPGSPVTHGQRHHRSRAAFSALAPEGMLPARCSTESPSPSRSFCHSAPLAPRREPPCSRRPLRPPSVRPRRIRTPSSTKRGVTPSPPRVRASTRYSMKALLASRWRSACAARSCGRRVSVGPIPKLGGE